MSAARRVPFRLMLAATWAAACAPAHAGQRASTEAQAATVTTTQELELDPVHTRLGFKLRTRWGHWLQGWFPHYDASISVLPDGRHQVRLALYVAEIDVDDSPKYSDMARSEGFFDARQYPLVTWTSDPYDAALVRRGGEMPGTLSMRGVSRPGKLQLQPPPLGCVRPGVDCDVLASGEILRSDYGMTGWKLAIDDHVDFVLRMRLLPQSASSVAP